MLGDNQPLLTAEMCVKPGEFYIYCLLLMTKILISPAMTLEHSWCLLWGPEVKDRDSLQDEVTQWLMTNMDFSQLSAVVRSMVHFPSLWKPRGNLSNLIFGC